MNADAHEAAETAAGTTSSKAKRPVGRLATAANKLARAITGQAHGGRGALWALGLAGTTAK